MTAVVNHLAQMVTLLLVDLRQIMNHSSNKKFNGKNKSDKKGDSTCASLPADDPPHTPIFDQFLGEEILDNILTWSLSTGEYMNVLKLEQLKVSKIMFHCGYLHCY